MMKKKKPAKTMTLPNPAGELVCCSLCGRDTRAKTCLCNRCGGRQSLDSMFPVDEEADDEPSYEIDLGGMD